MAAQGDKSHVFGNLFFLGVICDLQQFFAQDQLGGKCADYGQRYGFEATT